jgi:hypothetical protein
VEQDVVETAGSAHVLLPTVAALSFLLAYGVGRGLHKQVLLWVPRTALEGSEHCAAVCRGLYARACAEGHGRSAMGQRSGYAGAEMDEPEELCEAEGIVGVRAL